MSILRFTVVLIVGAVVLLLDSQAVSAASSISAVSLSSYSDCEGGGVDITIETVDVLREYGTASVNGVNILEFEQSAGLGNFSGTYFGYNYPFPDQPENSLITLYGYTGDTPPTSDNTIEWRLTYNCTTKAVSDVCYGVYPACSGGTTPTTSASCPNPLPSGMVVRSVPAGALAYYSDDSTTYAGFNLAPGTWYTRLADNTDFYEVWIACSGNNVFIPAANVVG